MKVRQLLIFFDILSFSTVRTYNALYFTERRIAKDWQSTVFVITSMSIRTKHNVYTVLSNEELSGFMNTVVNSTVAYF